MKTRKAFLAKVLAAAVVITSVLPVGTLTASAAPTVKTEQEQVKWMYADDDGNFTMKPQYWIDSQTGKESNMFGANLLLGDAMESWGFQALETDGSGHGDLSADGAATTIYASGIDIKSKGVRRVMQFDMVKLTDAGNQFGILLKYVDANNWVYLGYNGNHEWYIEWRNGSAGGYCNASGSIARNYTDGDGVAHDSWDPNIASVRVEKDKYLRIRLTYENSKNIRIAMTELEEGTDDDGNKILTEKADTTKEDLLSFKAFNDVRDYANDGDKPIHFGFIGDKRTSAIKINFLNVKKGALKDKSLTSQEPDEWVESLENVTFQDCGWNSPKASKDQLETIIKEQRIGDGVTYASIGDPNNDNKKTPDVTIYNNLVTDFSEGTISADLRPYTVGDNKEFYLGVMTAAAPEGKTKSFKIGMKGTKWAYVIDDTVTELSGDDLPAITEKTDYTVKAAIDAEGNVTANVTTETDDTPATVDLIKASDNVKVNGLVGSVSLTAKNEVLRVKHVTCDQITYEKTPLEEAYEEIADANENYEIYTDVWGAFAVSPQGPLTTAKGLLEGEHKDKVFNLSPQGASNADWVLYDASFDADAAAELRSKFNEINVSANKVATGKAELQSELDKVIAPTDTNAAKWYTTESLAAYRATWNAVKAFIDETLDLEAEGFAGVTKAAVEAKKAEIQAAPDKLERKTATSEDIEKVNDALETALAGIEIANDEQYYDNWADFKAAVEAAQALTEDGANPTVEEVDAKIAALNSAKAALRAKTVSSLTAYQEEIDKVTGDTITEEYYKGDFKAYTDALAAARAIKAGDSLKDADAKIKTLKDAFAALSLKTLADDAAGTTALQNEINAIKTEVAGKKYVQDANWTAYQNALAALEALMVKTDSTKLDVQKALAALKEAKNALKADATPDPTPIVNDPAVGSPYTDAASGMAYTVGANQTLTLTSGNKSAKTVTINTVTINGKEYKVTEIAANAFKNAKMTKLTVGDNVTTINKNAFAGCKALKTVTFGKNVKSIKANAFSKCTKINTVTFKNAKKLPSMKNAFKNANKKPKKVNVKKALVKNAKKKKSVLNALKAAGFKKITAKNIKGVK